MDLDIIVSALQVFWGFIFFIVIYILYGWGKNIVNDIDMFDDSSDVIDYLKNKRV